MTQQLLLMVISAGLGLLVSFMLLYVRSLKRESELRALAQQADLRRELDKMTAAVDAQREKHEQFRVKAAETYIDKSEFVRVVAGFEEQLERFATSTQVAFKEVDKQYRTVSEMLTRLVAGCPNQEAKAE